MRIELAIALFRLAVQIIALVQQARWYQAGRDAVYAQLSEEQRKRLALAEAARADADALNADPERLREDDGSRRD